MTTATRIGPKEVREHKESGEGTILVCAYEDDAKFEQNHLDGAISLDAFEKRLDSIPKDAEIVFYWGWPEDKTAVGRAAEYEQRGYENAKVLDGGVDAWKDAGLPMI